jgi:K+-transporting ATPase ATPase C chain
VVRARGITTAQVLDIVRRNQHDGQLGLFGEPVINVLQLNIELDQAYRAQL